MKVLSRLAVPLDRVGLILREPPSGGGSTLCIDGHQLVELLFGCFRPALPGGDPHFDTTGIDVDRRYGITSLEWHERPVLSKRPHGPSCPRERPFRDRLTPYLDVFRRPISRTRAFWTSFAAFEALKSHTA